MPMVFGGYRQHGYVMGVRVRDGVSTCLDCGRSVEAGGDKCAGRLVAQNIGTAYADRASAAPHKIALACPARVFSHEELNTRANQFARYLVDHGAGRERVVAVQLRRADSIVVALLGTMKAGGTYLAIDPEAPAARVRSQLAEAAAIRVETEDSWERIDWAAYSGGDCAAPVPESHLAYVIYPSDSTGAHERVAVEHRGLWNRLKAKTVALQLNADDVVAHASLEPLDAVIWHTLAVLLAGGRMVICDRATCGDPARLARWARECGVTILEIGPATLEGLLSLSGPAADIPTLRHLLVRGHGLPTASRLEWHGPEPRASLWNGGVAALAPTTIGQVAELGSERR
jgi:non-ribosomal peptide synthetase component F